MIHFLVRGRRLWLLWNPNVIMSVMNSMPNTSILPNVGSRKAEQGNGPSTFDMVPIERALLRTVPWLVGALLLSIPLLLIDTGSDPLVAFIAQLVALVAFGLMLANVLVPLGTPQWFVEMGWSPFVRLVAGGIGLVVLVTGTVGLVTLASSAALGFDPSTQFLQLISALDIAWVGAAVMIGVYRAWGRVWAVAGGAVIGVICVWSIWAYLDHVGFGPNGEWIVSSPDLLRFVLPFDVVAAVTAVGFFLFGARRAAQTTEQPRPQS